MSKRPRYYLASHVLFVDEGFPERFRLECPECGKTSALTSDEWNTRGAVCSACGYHEDKPNERTHCCNCGEKKAYEETCPVCGYIEWKLGRSRTVNWNVRKATA